MRNGLNIGASSEMMHEILTNDAEAMVRFGTHTRPIPGGAEVAIRAVRAGTIRIARDFSWPTTASARAERALPTPSELLLMSLGGCVLLTWIQGCTVKGITLSKLAIRVRGKLGSGAERAGGLKNVGYEVTVESDATPAQLVTVATSATCFSPMHRTFVEANETSTRLTAMQKLGASNSALNRVPRRAHVQSSSGPGLVEPREGELSVSLQWRYATHFEGGVEGAWGLEMDNPKQLNGLDRGPNAQEMMLAAMTTDAIDAFAQSPALALSQVDARADINLRGHFNTGQYPVRVHNIEYAVAVPSELRDDVAHVRALIAATPTHETIVTPTPISVSVMNGGTQIHEEQSDFNAVQRHLAELVKHHG